MATATASADGSTVDGVEYLVVNPETNEEQVVVVPHGYQLVVAENGELQIVEVAAGEAAPAATTTHDTAGDVSGSGSQQTVIAQAADGGQIIVNADDYDPNEQYCMLQTETGPVLVPVSGLDPESLAALGVQVEDASAAPSAGSGGLVGMPVASEASQSPPATFKQQTMPASPSLRTRSKAMAPAVATGESQRFVDASSTAAAVDTDSSTIKMRSGFKCNECPFESRFIKDITRHVKIDHTTIRPFNCNLCDFADVDETGIQEHLAAEHAGQSDNTQNTGCDSLLLSELKKMARTLYQCKIRNVSVFEQVKQEDGIIITTNAADKDETSKVVPGSLVVWNEKSGVSPPTLNDPYEKIRNRYFCEQCPFSCVYYMNALAHVQSAHGFAFPYSCPYCYYETYDETAAASHVKEVHGNRPQGIKINLDVETQVANWSKKVVVKGSHAFPQGRRGASGAPFISGARTQAAALISRKIQVCRCKQCPFQSRDETKVRKHVRDNHMDASAYLPWRCKLCNYMGQDRSVVEEHTRQKHPGRSSELYYDVKKPQELRDAILSLFSVEVIDMDSGLPVEVDDQGNVASRTSDLVAFVPDGPGGGGALGSRIGARGKRYICKNCGLRTNGLQHIKKHVISSHTPHRPFTCTLCNFSMATHLSIIRHLQKYHEVEDYKAHINIDQDLLDTIADQVFSMFSEVEEGGQMVDARPSSESAGVASSSAHDGGTGAKSTSEGLWTCRFPLCKYASKNRRDATLHVKRMHQRSKPYRCPLCDYATVSGEAFLQKHMTKNHPNEKAEIVVDQQEAASVDKFADENVELVYPTIRNKEPLSAVLANSSATAASTGTANVTAAPPADVVTTTRYSCNICQHTTDMKMAIEEHVQSEHINLQPYKCPTCSQKFRVKTTAVSHISETHDGSTELPIIDEKLLAQQKTRTAAKYTVEQVESKRPGHKLLVTDNEVENSALVPEDDDNNDELIPPVKRTDFSFHCTQCDFHNKSLDKSERHVLEKHSEDTPFSCNLCTEDSTRFRASSELAVASHVKQKHRERDPKKLEEAVHCDTDAYDSLAPSLRSNLRAVHDSSDETITVADLLKREQLSRRKYEAPQPPASSSPVDDSASQLPKSLLRAAERGSSTAGRKLTTDDQYTFYRCKQCSFQAAYLSATRYHVITHTRYRPYSCLVCGFMTNRHANVAKHVKNYHGGQLASYKDGINFDEKLMQSIESELDDNILVLDMKVAKDESANTAPSQAGDATAEGMGTGGLARYRCTRCGYVVVGVVQNIRQHCLKHSGHKPYKCTVCDHENITHGALRSHIQFKHPELAAQASTYVQADKQLLRAIRSELDQMYVMEQRIKGAEQAVFERSAALREEQFRRRAARQIGRLGGDASWPMGAMRRRGRGRGVVGRVFRPKYDMDDNERSVGVGTTSDFLASNKPLFSLNDSQVAMEFFDVDIDEFVLASSIIKPTGIESEFLYGDDLDRVVRGDEIFDASHLEDLEDQRMASAGRGRGRGRGRRGRPPLTSYTFGRPGPAKFDMKELVELVDDDRPSTRLSVGTYKCKLCDFSSALEAEIDSHVRNMHFTSLTPFSCSLCGHKGVDSLALKKHLSQAHPVGSDGKVLVDEDLRASLIAVVKNMYDVTDEAQTSPATRRRPAPSPSSSPSRTAGPAAAAASAKTQVPNPTYSRRVTFADPEDAYADAEEDQPQTTPTKRGRPGTGEKEKPGSPEQKRVRLDSSGSGAEAGHSEQTGEKPEEAEEVAGPVVTGRRTRAANQAEPSTKTFSCKQCGWRVGELAPTKIRDHCFEKHISQDEWFLMCKSCDFRHYEVSAMMEHKKQQHKTLKGSNFERDEQLKALTDEKVDAMYATV